MVPMSESQITKLEKAGEFPQRFALTNRTVARNLDEVEAGSMSNRPRIPAARRIIPRCPPAQATASTGASSMNIKRHIMRNAWAYMFAGLFVWWFATILIIVWAVKS